MPESPRASSFCYGHSGAGEPPGRISMRPAVWSGSEAEQQLVAFAHAIGGAAHQLAQWWLRTPGVSRAYVVESFCAVTWGGLAAVLGIT
jgi:tetracycline repressor-like protein